MLLSLIGADSCKFQRYLKETRKHYCQLLQLTKVASRATLKELERTMFPINLFLFLFLFPIPNTVAFRATK